MAWSDAARRAALLARKLKAHPAKSKLMITTDNARIRRDFLKTKLAHQEKVWGWHVKDKNNEAANRVNDSMRRTRDYLRGAEKALRNLRRK